MPFALPANPLWPVENCGRCPGPVSNPEGSRLVRGQALGYFVRIGVLSGVFLSFL